MKRSNCLTRQIVRSLTDKTTRQAITRKGRNCGHLLLWHRVSSSAKQQKESMRDQQSLPAPALPFLPKSVNNNVCTGTHLNINQPEAEHLCIGGVCSKMCPGRIQGGLRGTAAATAHTAQAGIPEDIFSGLFLFCLVDPAQHALQSRGQFGQLTHSSLQAAHKASVLQLKVQTAAVKSRQVMAINHLIWHEL